MLLGPNQTLQQNEFTIALRCRLWQVSRADFPDGDDILRIASLTRLALAG